MVILGEYVVHVIFGSRGLGVACCGGIAERGNVAWCGSGAWGVVGDLFAEVSM